MSVRPAPSTLGMSPQCIAPATRTTMQINFLRNQSSPHISKMASCRRNFQFSNHSIVSNTDLPSQRCWRVDFRAARNRAPQTKPAPPKTSIRSKLITNCARGQTTPPLPTETTKLSLSVTSKFQIHVQVHVTNRRASLRHSPRRSYSKPSKQSPK